MAVTQTDEGLELQLLDYLLMAREATSVEIAEEAKAIEPVDVTPDPIHSFWGFKLLGVCLRLGPSVRIEPTPSGKMPPDALDMELVFQTGGRDMELVFQTGGRELAGAPVPIPVNLSLGCRMGGELRWLDSKISIWHNEMPRPKTPQEYMAIIWSRLGRKELSTHLLHQVEVWARIVGGA